MTVGTSIPRERYTGNGVTSQFSFGHVIEDVSEIQVWKTVGAVTTLQTLNVNYEVIQGEDPDENTIKWVVATVETPLPNGNVLTLMRATPQLQGDDLINAGGIYLATFEAICDRLARMIQDVNVHVTRSIELDIEDVDDGSGTYNAKGNRIRNVGDAIADDEALNKGQFDALLDDAALDITESVAAAAASAATAVSAASSAGASATSADASEADAEAAAASAAASLATILASARIVLTGSGAPAGGLGSNGDVYIDYTNWKVHKKAAGVWDAGTNMIGASGTGDVNGPASSVANEVALFSDTTGKLIKRATGTGVAVLTSGVLSAVSPLTTALGGLGVALSDPNADRGVMWDDSAGNHVYFDFGTGISIVGTTLTLHANLVTLAGYGSMSVLSALAAYNTNGLLTQTAANTFTGRTITGTANQITVNNGNGVSGNPTLSLPQDIATTSNPQFATIELGHATNTTIGRPGAGDISIEGNIVYRAGGTDVAIADGGLGVSLTDPSVDSGLFWDDSAGFMAYWTPTGALSFSGTNLIIAAASTTVVGAAEIATAAEYRTGTDTGRVLGVAEVWAAGAIVALTDAATVAVDMSTFVNASVALGGNRTLGAPSAVKVGQSGVIIATAVTSTRTLDKHANYIDLTGTTWPISITTAQKAYITYWCESSTRIIVTGVKVV